MPPFNLDPTAPAGARPDFSALETRALALVNPRSGIANDYLNLFNEIIMLIENFPAMPELGSDILSWQLVSYHQYFAGSSLPGRSIALAAYDRLEPEVRGAFESVAAEIADLAAAAAEQIRLHGDNDLTRDIVAQFCAETSAEMMACLKRATHIVNYGQIQQFDDPQERVERLMLRRSNPHPGRRRVDRG